jgi:hypothetical protein
MPLQVIAAAQHVTSITECNAHVTHCLLLYDGLMGDTISETGLPSGPQVVPIVDTNGDGGDSLLTRFDEFEEDPCTGVTSCRASSKLRLICASLTLLPASSKICLF